MQLQQRSSSWSEFSMKPYCSIVYTIATQILYVVIRLWPYIGLDSSQIPGIEFLMNNEISEPNLQFHDACYWAIINDLQ